MFGKRLRRGDPQDLSALARAVLIDERTALRAEILASYGYAQSIVKWTLAVFATLTGAGLVAINNSASDPNDSILTFAVLILFGFGLPGIVWLNASTWLGELYRAERAGSYLRALESSIANIPGLRDQLGMEPARWERFILHSRASKSMWGKQVVTYVGTAGTFFGCAGGSFIVLWLVVGRLFGENWFDPGYFGWFWIIGSFVANVVGMGVCLLIYRRLAKMGAAVAPLRDSY